MCEGLGRDEKKIVRFHVGDMFFNDRTYANRAQTYLKEMQKGCDEFKGKTALNDSEYLIRGEISKPEIQLNTAKPTSIQKRKMTGKNQCFLEKLNCFVTSATDSELFLKNTCSHGLLIIPGFKYYAKKPESVHSVEKNGQYPDLYLQSGKSISIPKNNNKTPVSYLIDYLGTTKKIEEQKLKIAELCYSGNSAMYNVKSVKIK